MAQVPRTGWRKALGNPLAGRLASLPSPAPRSVLYQPRIDVLEQRQLMTVTPLGGEIQVNENINGDQQLARPSILPSPFNDIEKSNRSVAVDHDGDFIVVWTSYGDADGDGSGVFGRLFNRFSIPLTGDFQINQFTEGDQRNATVAMDADGDFIVAWESSVQDQYDGSSGIYARRYNSVGAPLTDEFQVNTLDIGPQIHPAIAADNDGNFIIAWESQSQDGSFFNNLKAQRYRFDATPIGSEIRVNQTGVPGLFGDSNPAVAMAPNGNFAISWDIRIRQTIPGVPIIGSQVMMRMFDSNGSPITNETPVSRPDVDPYDNLTDEPGPNDGHVFLDASEFEQRNSSIAMDDQGNVTIVWESLQDNDFIEDDDAINSWGIYLRRFHADGTAEAAFPQDLHVNPVYSWDPDVDDPPLFSPFFWFDQLNPSVGLDADGDLFVVYDGYGAATLGGALLDDQGVWLRRFTAPSALSVTDEDTGTTILESVGSLNYPLTPVNSTRPGGQQHPTIAVQPNGSFIVVWSGNGPGDTQGIFAQRFRESADPVGPQITELRVEAFNAQGQVVPDERQLLLNGEQVVGNVTKLVAVFDEQASTAGGANGVNSVLNKNNWKLLRNGVEILNGINAVAYQLNPLTNKWEATLTLDSNGPLSGTPALVDGNYEVIALNTIRDVAGNPLASNGLEEDGFPYSLNFNVIASQSGESLVNTTTPGSQVTLPESPQAVATDASGGYVVTWTAAGQQGDAANETNVYARRFAADGTPLGAEFRVNTVVAGNQSNSAVTMTPDGDFIIVWASESADFDQSWDIFGQRFDSLGNRLGGEFLVNTTTESIQSFPTVAVDTEGDFIVAWQSFGQEDSTSPDPNLNGYGVYAQRFNASAEPLGGVNEVQTVSFSGNPTGGFFSLQLNGFNYGPITYSPANAGTNTAAAIEDALRNPGVGIPPLEVSVRARSSTQYEITFEGNSGSRNQPQFAAVGVTLIGGTQPKMQVRTSTDGVAGEFLVNDTILNNQRFPQAATDADGDFVIVWVSAGQDGDQFFESNLYAKTYSRNELLGGAGGPAVDALVGHDDDHAHLESDPLGGLASDGLLYDVPDGPLSDDFVLGPSTPGKWGPAQFGTGATITWAFMSAGVRDANDLDGGWTSVSLDSVMPIGYKDQIREAFAAWARVANLTFVEVVDSGENFGDPGAADIRVGAHPIDGTFGVLAHAFFPPENGGFVAGDVHFDSSENWQIGFGNPGIDIFQVFAHELGHALGLGHTDVPNSLMNPIYSEAFRGPQFDDIAGIQFLYGAADNGSTRPEFRINQTVAGNQFAPSVSMDLDGDFVVTWTSYGQDRNGTGYGFGQGGQNGIFARRFTADGNPMNAETFTESYISGNAPLVVADVGSTASELQVPDDFIVTSLTVTLDVTHPRVSDLTLTLYPPGQNPFAGGAGITLASGLGGNGRNYAGTTFSDSASTPITAALPPFTGTFQPVGALNSLAGIRAQGTWQLVVTDAATGQVGQLNGWSLSFRGVVEAGDEFQVNRFADGNQQFSRVSMNGAGDFIIAWESFQDDSVRLGTPSDYGIYAQRYVRRELLSTQAFATGGAIGSQFRVPFTKAGDQRYPGVALDSGGDFVVVWSGRGDNSGGVVDNPGVFQRRFSSTADTGAPIVTGVVHITNEVQRLTITGAPTSGSFSLLLAGKTYGPFSYTPSDATSLAAAMQAALSADFTVAVSATSSTEFDFQFSGTDSATNIPTIQVTGATFTGGTNPAAVATTEVPGGTDVVTERDVVEQAVQRLVVRFSEQLSVAGGITGLNSVINPENWAIARNGVLLSDSIVSITFGFNEAATQGLGPASGKWEAVVTFDANTSQAGLQPLLDGEYILAVLPAVRDLQGNPLDGNFDGAPGGTFNRNFFIQIPPPTGDGETRVNTTIPPVQRFEPESASTIAMDADGDYVVVWTSAGQDGDGDGVYFQRFSANGTPLGPETLAAQTTLGNQNHGNVALDADGDFIITWTGYGQIGDGPTSGNVYARRFASNGTPLGDELLVNSFTVGSQKWSNVAVDVLGDFVVTWSSYGQDGSGYGVYAQRYNSSGGKEGGEFRINQVTAGSQRFSDVAMDADGNFVVTWTASGQDGSGDAVLVRAYSASGTPLTNEQLVNTTTTGDQRYSRVAADLAGNFVVAWTGLDTSGTGVFFRQFSSVDFTAGPETQANVTVTGNQQFANVSVDHDGDFVITWSGNGAQPNQVDQSGVFARRFNSDGTARPAPSEVGGGTEFLVNTTLDGTQSLAGVALDGKGQFVVTWNGNGVGDTQGIFARRFRQTVDDAGPIVSDVRLSGIQILDGDVITADVSFLNVVFGEEMSTVGDDLGFESVTNAANWALFRNGAELIGGIRGVVFEFDPGPRKWKARLLFDGDGLAGDPDAPPTLPDGVYTLVAFDFMTDTSGNQLDGDYDGLEGGNFTRTFTIARPKTAGDEFRANTTTVDAQRTGAVGQAVASDDDGDYVVVWTSPDGSGLGVFAQRFNKEGAKLGPEFLVNTEFTTNDQFDPAVAMDADGDFVISWTSYGQDDDSLSETNVYTKVYNSVGEVVVGAQLANTTLDGVQKWSSVAMDADGDFVVTWTGLGQNGDDQFDGNIFARKFTYEGVSAGDEFQVNNLINEYVNDGTLFIPRQGTVTSEIEVEDTFDILDLNVTVSILHPNVEDLQLVLIGPDGTQVLLAQDLAPGANISRTTFDDEASVPIAAGTPPFIGTFRPIGDLTDFEGLSVQGTWSLQITDSVLRVDANGNPIEPEVSNTRLSNWALEFAYTGGSTNTSVVPTESGNQQRSRIAMDAGGNFVVVWEDQSGMDSDGAGVYGQTYFFDSSDENQDDPTPEPIGANFRINQTIIGNQMEPSVASDRRNGDFVVAWASQGQDGDGYGVYARRFTQAGTSVSDEFQVNRTTAGDQRRPTVAMAATDDFIIVWEGNGAAVNQSDDLGIFAQCYLSGGGRRGGEFRVNTTTDDAQQFPSVAADGRGDFVVVWSGNGQQPGQEDTVGVFGQRLAVEGDTAGPIVADVVFDANGSHIRLGSEEELIGPVDVFVVSFGEEMLADSTTAAGSITNLANWAVTRGSGGGTGGVAAVTFGFNQASIEGVGPVSNRWEAVVRLDANGSSPGAPGFGAGTYTLAVNRAVRDLLGNNLDGTFQGSGGQGGTTYTVSFTVAGGGEDCPGGLHAEGEETLLNQTTLGLQDFSDVAADSKGNYVAVWVSGGQVIARRFNAASVALGDEFIVNSEVLPGASQPTPQVAMDDRGNFVITWTGRSLELDSDRDGIFARRYNRVGTAQGEQFLVNTYKAGLQNQPDVAMDADGDFVITWNSYGQTGQFKGIFAQRYTSGGATRGGEFAVNLNVTTQKEKPRVAMDADGDFVVTWSSYGQDGSGWGVFARRFNSAGVPQNGEFQVNQVAFNAQREPAIAMDADGDFVIVWQSDGQDTSGYGVYGRTYNRLGVAKGAEFQVNEYSLNWQRYADVAMDDAGNFFVTWMSFGQDADRNGIFLKAYTADGAEAVDPATSIRIGERVVNTTSSGEQSNPTIATSASGKLLVAWTSQQATPSTEQSDIFSQRFCFDPTMATITGTAAGDSLVITVGASGATQATLNGQPLNISPLVTNLVFDGAGGTNSVVINGAASTHQLQVSPGGGSLSSSLFSLLYSNVSNTRALGSAASTATMLDSSGNDTLVTTPSSAKLTGNGFTLEVDQYGKVNVVGSGGQDSATMADSSGNDTVVARAYSTTLAGSGYSQTVSNFKQVKVNGSSGFDRASLYDSSGNDTLVARPGNSSLTGSGFSNQLLGFDEVRAYASNGLDRAELYDSTGDDTLTIRPEYSQLVGSTYFSYAKGFDDVRATGSGGADKAFLYDSPGTDTLTLRPQSAQFVGSNFFAQATNFSQVRAYATTGADNLYLYDSAGNDQLVATPEYAQLSGAGFLSYAKGFRNNRAYATGGYNSAVLYSSAGNDELVARSDSTQLTGRSYFNYAKSFSEVRAYSQGTGQANLYDTAGDDVLLATPQFSQLVGSGYLNYTSGFAAVRTFASTGNDSAVIYDSLGKDQLISTPEYSQLSGSGYMTYAKNFKSVTVQGGRGGQDTALLYDSAGSDQVTTRPESVELKSTGVTTEARNFASVQVASQGGNDTAVMYTGSAGTNELYAGSQTSRLVTGSTQQTVVGFSNVSVQGTGGYSRAYLVDSVMTDNLAAQGNTAQISNELWSAQIQNFQEVTAESIFTAKKNTKHIGAVDFLFTDKWF